MRWDRSEPALSEVEGPVQVERSSTSFTLVISESIQMQDNSAPIREKPLPENQPVPENISELPA